MSGLKKIKLWTLLVLAVSFSLYAFLLNPLEIMIQADTTYAEWEYLLAAYARELNDVFALIWVYAVTACVLYRNGAKAIGGVACIYAGLSLYKTVANWLFGCLTDVGALPTWTEFFLDDLWAMAGAWLPDLLVYAAFILILVLSTRRMRHRMAEGSLAVTEPTSFADLLDMKKPMPWAACLIGIFMVAIRWGLHLLEQISLWSYELVEDLAVVLSRLAIDLLIGVIAYFLAVLLMQLLDRMNTKRAK